MALNEITNMRLAWIKKFPNEEPDIVVIGWGVFEYNNGRSRGMPMVSFYTKDRREEMIKHAQTMNGLEIIFFTIPPYLALFKGKVLDFSEAQGFFLRDP